MTDVQFELHGVNEIVAKLSTFSPKLQQAAGRKSARRAMAVVRAAARDAVRQHDDPESFERIWKNVYIQQSRRQSAAVGGVVMRVGVLGGARQYAKTKANVRKGRAGKSYKTGGDKGNPGGDTWYWRMLEFGHRVAHGKSGRIKYTRKVTPRGGFRNVPVTSGTQNVPAYPFLLPALMNNAQSVLTTLTTELNREIDTIAAKG